MARQAAERQDVNDHHEDREKREEEVEEQKIKDMVKRAMASKMKIEARKTWEAGRSAKESGYEQWLAQHRVELENDLKLDKYVTGAIVLGRMLAAAWEYRESQGSQQHVYPKDSDAPEEV